MKVSMEKKCKKWPVEADILDYYLNLTNILVVDWEMIHEGKNMEGLSDPAEEGKPIEINIEGGCHVQSG